MQCVIKSVAQYGFENASVKVISKSAGVSPSTIYCYYDNKEELFEATFMYLAGVFCRFYSSDVFGLMGQSKEETCHNFWNHYIKFYMANADAVLFYVRYRHSAYYSNEVRQRAEDFERTYFEYTKRIAECIGLSSENNVASVVMRFFSEAVLLYAEQLLTGKAMPNQNDLAFQTVYAAMMAIENSYHQ